MDKALRFGEVVSVKVTYDPATSLESSIVRYRLYVVAWSRFLHPASYQAGLDDGQEPGYFIQMRFKELHSIHKQLTWLYTSIKLPEFPPKKWLFGKSESFLLERAGKLNDYFQALLQIGEMRRSQVLVEALRPGKAICLKVLGKRNIGKAKFVQNFLHYNPAASFTRYTRTSASLPSINSFTDMDQLTPVDLLIDQQAVRIASIEFLATDRGDLNTVTMDQDTTVCLVLKTKADPVRDEFLKKLFAACRWGECGKGKMYDTEDAKREAFETVYELLRDYLKVFIQ